MAVEIGNDKRIGGKFMDSFIAGRGIIANIAGGVGIPVFLDAVF